MTGCVLRVEATSIAKPEIVFALLKDGATWPSWSFFTGFELKAPGTPDAMGVGSIRVFSTRVSRACEQVVELVPGRRLAYVLLSGLPLRDYRAAVDLTPLPSGGCRNVWQASFRSDPAWTTWFWRWFMRRTLREVARALASAADCASSAEAGCMADCVALPSACELTVSAAGPARLRQLDAKPHRGGAARRYFADTFAMVTFSLAVGAFIELVIAGLTVEQTLKVRAAALPLSLLIGRPYGVYRDWVFVRVERWTGRPQRPALVDTFCNLTFQVPLYATILAFNGAKLTQIATACGSLMLVSSLTGRPYGLFLGFCRSLFRAE